MTPKRPDHIPLLERELTGEIIGEFFRCYNELGFGFIESVYSRDIEIELRARNLRVFEEAPIEVYFRGVIAGSFRVDLLVNERVVVEVKAASTLGPTDKRQLINYLRATQLEVGLLLHFAPEPKFHRFANRSWQSA